MMYSHDFRPAALMFVCFQRHYSDQADIFSDFGIQSEMAIGPSLSVPEYLLSEALQRRELDSI